MMIPCDVADCPREGTNELEATVTGPTGEPVKTTVQLCDHDFRVLHDAAVGFSLGTDAER